MKNELIAEVMQIMLPVLDNAQLKQLKQVIPKLVIIMIQTIYKLVIMMNQMI